MKKKMIPTVFLLLLLISLTTFSGCVIRPTPYEYFDSLQELKDSIGNRSSIIFPDTTGYVFADDTVKFRKVYVEKSNIFQGYSFNSELDEFKSDTSLFYLNCKGNILEKQYDERNPPPDLEPNTEISGVSVVEKLYDASENPNTFSSKMYIGQEGSKIHVLYYQFDLNGCRYSVLGHMFIPITDLENMKDKDVDAKVENFENEVLFLVESIIKQEENEKSSD